MCKNKMYRTKTLLEEAEDRFNKNITEIKDQLWKLTEEVRFMKRCMGSLTKTIVKNCVEIGAVNTQEDALTRLVELNYSHALGVIGTVRSKEFSTCKPDLILSVHGFKKGDTFCIKNREDILQHDILGDGPDYTFEQPVNVVGAIYTPLSISSQEDISFRGVWLLSSIRLKLYDFDIHKEGKYLFRYHQGIMGCVAQDQLKESGNE